MVVCLFEVWNKLDISNIYIQILIVFLLERNIMKWDSIWSYSNIFTLVELFHDFLCSLLGLLVVHPHLRERRISSGSLVRCDLIGLAALQMLYLCMIFNIFLYLFLQVLWLDWCCGDIWELPDVNATCSAS